MQLAAFMNDYSAGKPIIVGGDFNLHSDDEPDATVFTTFLDATGLTDTCEVVDCGDDAGAIDKFAFRSGGGITLTALTHQFEPTKFERADGEPLSDHDALAVTFQWTAPPLAPSSSTTSTTTANTQAVRPAFTG